MAHSSNTFTGTHSWCSKKRLRQFVHKHSHDREGSSSMAMNVLTAVHTQLHLCLWQTCSAELGTWDPPPLLLTNSIPHQLTSHHPRFEGADHWVMPCAHPQGREKYIRALFSWRSNWFFLPQSSQDSLCNLPKLLGKSGGLPLGRKQQGLGAKARFRS